MSAAKHTSEPWELCQRGDYSDFDGQCRVIVSDDRRLAVVHVSDEETDANAQLMVSAPKLLAALRMVCDSGVELADPIERAVLDAFKSAESA